MTRPPLWQVVIVRIGTLQSTRSAMFANSAGDERPQDIDYHFWLLRGPGEQVLVDTGFSLAAASRRGRTATLDPAAALATLGLDANWTGTVVLTHAHWDHTGQLANLPRARAVVSARELLFWRDLPADDPARDLTEAADLAALQRAQREGRIDPVDGVVELRPGLRVLPAPGHTPGQLAVAVATSDGDVLLTSDAVHFDEELQDRLPFRYMSHLDEAHRSYELLADLLQNSVVGHLVTGHEPGTVHRYPDLGGPLSGHASTIGSAPAAEELHPLRKGTTL
jgi:glyoxylase-like metal-dependent hydrolase (beta-lactamase superfamily II)